MNTETVAIVKANEFTKLIAEKKDLYSALTIKGLNDKEGYTAIDIARKDIKKIRVEIEKAFKSERDVLNVAVKENLSKEKEILLLVTPLENELAAKQSVIDNEKQRIKDEDAVKEKAKIDARFARINKLALTFDGSNYNYKEQRISSVDIQTASDEMIDTFIFDVETEKENDAKIAAKAAELLAEKQAVIKLEQENQANILAKQKADQDKKDEEQAKKEAELKAKQDAIDKQQQEILDVKLKEVADKKRLVELEEAKKEAAQKALFDAELKRNQDEVIKNEAERKKAEETARIEKMRPDKEKFIEVANAIHFSSLNPQSFTSKEAIAIIDKVRIKFEELKKFIIDEANKL